MNNNYSYSILPHSHIPPLYHPSSHIPPPYSHPHILPFTTHQSPHYPPLSTPPTALHTTHRSSHHTPVSTPPTGHLHTSALASFHLVTCLVSRTSTLKVCSVESYNPACIEGRRRGEERGREEGIEGGRNGRREEGIKWSLLVGVVVLRIQQLCYVGMVATECGDNVTI